MSKIIYAAAVLILSNLLCSVACVSSAEKEAMYSEILARAQVRRDAIRVAPSQDWNKKGRLRTFSVEQAQLIEDVTLAFGVSMTVSEKFKYFGRLMGELGIAEEPVRFSRFQELSGIVTRHERGQEMSRGDTSKIEPEVLEQLEAMLSENPMLTYTVAVEKLQKRGGRVKLPPRAYLENWLRYRRKVLGFLKLLQDPSDEKMSSNDAPVTNDLADDDFTCSFSVFSDDLEGGRDEGEGECCEEKEVSDEEKDRKRSSACGSSDAACPATKRLRLDEKEEMYSTLLANAHARRPFKEIGTKKCTKEHSELIADVVKTCGPMLAKEQYEVLRRLISDLGIFGMSRSSFNHHAVSLRKQLGCSLANRVRIGLDPDIANFIKSLVDKDYAVSATKAFAALQRKNLSASFGDVQRWIKSYKTQVQEKAKKLRDKPRDEETPPTKTSGSKCTPSSRRRG